MAIDSREESSVVCGNPKISDLKLVMQEKRGRQTHLKNSIFDLDCEFDDGRTAVVEVQFNSSADYHGIQAEIGRLTKEGRL